MITMMIVLTIIMTILFVIILLSLFNSVKQVNNLEIVVSRYNEDLKWINTDPFNKYPLIVYNKGINNDFEHSSKIEKVVNTKNVGREGHTYLLHIINNYDNLADFTLFLPGSLEHQEKLWKAKKILSVFEDEKKCIYIEHPLPDDIMDFEISEHKSSNSQNLLVNDETKLLESDIKPFGKWYSNYFNDIKLDSISYLGVLAVKKEDILQHSKEYYEVFLNQLSTHSNPEVGHYIERTWSKIFYPSSSLKMII